MLTRNTMLVHRLLTSKWPFKCAVAEQARHAERQLTVDPVPEILPVSR
jgi:hypothetical protein